MLVTTEQRVRYHDLCGMKERGQVRAENRERFQSNIISGLKAIQTGWKENDGRPGDRMRISFVGSQDIELENKGEKIKCRSPKT